MLDWEISIRQKYVGYVECKLSKFKTFMFYRIFCKVFGCKTLFAPQNLRWVFYSIFHSPLFVWLPSSNLSETQSQGKHHHLLKTAKTIVRINTAKHPALRLISLVFKWWDDLRTHSAFRYMLQVTEIFSWGHF